MPNFPVLTKGLLKMSKKNWFPVSQKFRPILYSTKFLHLTYIFRKYRFGVDLRQFCSKRDALKSQILKN